MEIVWHVNPITKQTSVKSFKPFQERKNCTKETRIIGGTNWSEDIKSLLKSLKRIHVSWQPCGYGSYRIVNNEKRIYEILGLWEFWCFFCSVSDFLMNTCEKYWNSPASNEATIWGDDLSIIDNPLSLLLGYNLSFYIYIYILLYHMAVCQNLVPLVNIKIAGKWMFIPLKMVLIGIDPYPYIISNVVVAPMFGTSFAY